MTAAKHTTGPWKYVLNVGPTRALIVEQDGTTVVEMINRTYDDRFTANVRLMMSAPDLLSALCKWHSFMVANYKDGDISWAAETVAAIAKAEGRS